MLPKERVIRALEHQELDRVPTGEIGIDNQITEQVLGRKTLYRAKWDEYMALWQGRRDEYVESCKRDIVDLVKKLELDFVPVFLVPPKGYNPGMPEFLDEYTWKILDMMLEAGMDGYQAIELKAGMDMKELKEKYGGRLCLFGGVDCSTLIDGTTDEVQEEAEYAIRHAAKGGGLVITSGNTIQNGVKIENYLAMLETIKKKGVYPINL